MVKCMAMKKKLILILFFNPGQVRHTVQVMSNGGGMEPILGSTRLRYTLDEMPKLKMQDLYWPRGTDALQSLYVQPYLVSKRLNTVSNNTGSVKQYKTKTRQWHKGVQVPWMQTLPCVCWYRDRETSSRSGAGIRGGISWHRCSQAG